MVARLTEEELRQLATALKKKLRRARAFAPNDDEEWDPILLVVVDTELVVSGAVPLSAFTNEEVAETAPDDPYLWESGT